MFQPYSDYPYVNQIPTTTTNTSNTRIQNHGPCFEWGSGFGVGFRIGGAQLCGSSTLQDQLLWRARLEALASDFSDPDFTISCSMARQFRCVGLGDVIQENLLGSAHVASRQGSLQDPVLNDLQLTRDHLPVVRCSTLRA